MNLVARPSDHVAAVAPTAIRSLRNRLAFTAVMAATAIFVAACSGAVAAPNTDDQPVDSPGGSTGMCAPGVVDCVDVVIAPSHETLVAAATDLIGRAEADLPADVRIGRRGTEHFALTEDYVVGRLTVSLEVDGDGVMRVVEVVAEGADGPITVGAGGLG